MAIFIGIDIGTRFTKVVQIEQKTKPHISKIFMFPTPYTDSKKISSKDFFNKITTHIPKKILKKSYIGINIPSVFTNTVVIDLPKMSQKELTTAVIMEAKRKMIPSPGPDSIFEYSILREIQKSGVVYYEILVVKTEKICIEDVLNLFNETKELAPSFISPICCVMPSFLLCTKERISKNIAFVNIGYESIDITITKDKKLDFYRNVKFGLKGVIQKISKSLNLSFQETEELIEDQGVPQIDIDLKDRIEVAEQIMRQKYEASLRGDSQKKINLLELRMLWQTEIERMIHEIRRSLIYYKESRGAERVKEIFFFGGGMCIRGLFEILAKNIGGNSKILQAFEYIESGALTEYPQEVPLFVGAVGVALSLSLMKGKEKTALVNFLPLELKKKEIIAARRVVILTVAIFIFGFIVLSYLNLLIGNKNLQTTINNTEDEIRNIEGIVDMLDELKHRRKIILAKSKKIEELSKNRVDFSPILKEIAKFTPQEVLINSLSIFKDSFSLEQESLNSNKSEDLEERDKGEGKRVESYKVKIEAQVVSDYEKAIKIIEKFKNNLEKSPYFKNVEATFPQLEKISIKEIASQEIQLTASKIRKFVIKAYIVRK